MITDPPERATDDPVLFVSVKLPGASAIGVGSEINALLTRSRQPSGMRWTGDLGELVTA